MQTETNIFPRISFKGVLIFMLIVAAGVILLVKPFMGMGLPRQWSLYLATAVSSTIGMSIVINVVDEKVQDRKKRRKRTILSFIVCFSVSFVLIFLTK